MHSACFHVLLSDWLVTEGVGLCISFNLVLNILRVLIILYWLRYNIWKKKNTFQMNTMNIISTKRGLYVKGAEHLCYIVYVIKANNGYQHNDHSYNSAMIIWWKLAYCISRYSPCRVVLKLHEEVEDIIVITCMYLPCVLRYNRESTLRVEV